MSAAKVGVKFCGQCNPRHDVQALYRRLVEKGAKTALDIRPLVQMPKPDAVLVLAGCGAACAEPPQTDRPVVWVAPGQVDGRATPPEGMADAVLARLSEVLER